MTRPIVVLGGGGHAKVVISTLRSTAEFRILGYTDTAEVGPAILDIARLGSDDVLARVAREHPDAAAAIGVGMMGSAAVRRKIEAQLIGLGLDLPVVRAASASIDQSAVIGPGTIAVLGVIVNPSARIGRCAILNTGCIVEHDVVIGDHTHVSPGAIICGGTEIGPDCWIGAGAVIARAARIAAGCVVGAGSVVLKDLTEKGTYAGVPARRVS